MRPLAALLAILAGSARFAPEQPALIRAVLIFGAFALVSSSSFYGQQRERRWRLLAHAATLGIFALAVWLYWPK